VVEAGT
jgi:hypothetical protein